MIRKFLKTLLLTSLTVLAMAAVVCAETKSINFKADEWQKSGIYAATNTDHNVNGFTVTHYGQNSALGVKFANKGIHYVMFNAKANDKLIFKTGVDSKDTDPPVDIYWNLCEGSVSTEIETKETSGSKNNHGEITFNIPNDGTYYIVPHSTKNTKSSVYISYISLESTGGSEEVTFPEAGFKDVYNETSQNGHVAPYIKEVKNYDGVESEQFGVETVINGGFEDGVFQVTSVKLLYATPGSDTASETSELRNYKGNDTDGYSFITIFSKGSSSEQVSKLKVQAEVDFIDKDNNTFKYYYTPIEVDVKAAV